MRKMRCVLWMDVLSAVDVQELSYLTAGMVVHGAEAHLAAGTEGAHSIRKTGATSAAIGDTTPVIARATEREAGEEEVVAERRAGKFCFDDDFTRCRSFSSWLLRFICDFFIFGNSVICFGSWGGEWEKGVAIPNRLEETRRYLRNCAPY